MSIINDLSPDELDKYTHFIQNYLDKEEALAGISKRLQNNGVSPELARELVRYVALGHSDGLKDKAIISVSIGGVALLIFSIIGINSESGFKFFIIAFFSFFGGIYQYRKSMKRLRYLKSIS